MNPTIWHQDALDKQLPVVTGGARPEKDVTSLKPIPEDALILVPLRNAVLFPGMISPITIGRPSSVAAAQEAVRAEKHVGFLLQRDPGKTDVVPSDLHWVGTSGQIV